MCLEENNIKFSRVLDNIFYYFKTLGTGFRYCLILPFVTSEGAPILSPGPYDVHDLRDTRCKQGLRWPGQDARWSLLQGY